LIEYREKNSMKAKRSEKEEFEAERSGKTKEDRNWKK
jgi:hypothetical protein